MENLQLTRKNFERADCYSPDRSSDPFSNSTCMRSLLLSREIFLLRKLLSLANSFHGFGFIENGAIRKNTVQNASDAIAELAKSIL